MGAYHRDSTADGSSGASETGTPTTGGLGPYDVFLRLLVLVLLHVLIGEAGR